jgi:hypothetical protein
LSSGRLSGNASDVRAAERSVNEFEDAMRLIADKGNDANVVRQILRVRRTSLIMVDRSSRQMKVVYDEKRNRERNRFVNASCRLKDFKRIDTRHEQRGRHFLSTVATALLMACQVRGSLEPLSALRS